MISRSQRHQLRRKRDAIELALFTGAPATAGEITREISSLSQDVGDEPRLAELETIAEGRGDRAAYIERYGVCGVRKFQSAGGATLYGVAAETLPNHVNNLYLIREGSRALVFDSGSQMPSSHEDLRRAEVVLKNVYGETIGLEGASDLIISHAHVDHFGGAGAFHERGTKVHVHAFDAKVIARFEERILTAAMLVRVFLKRAGVDEATQKELEQIWVFAKQMFKSVPVDHALEADDELYGYRIHHVPGHCPGQVCLQVHDVLLTADHVIARVTPHQSPESITPWTGLDHYFRSLEQIRHVPGITLALAGHEEPIHALGERIDEIEAFHRTRLDEVTRLCAAPRTLAEIARALFGDRHGFMWLLALEETAAHVEYLSRRGALDIANLDDLMRDENPVLRYQAASTATM